MRAVVLNWRDPENPQAGGAETHIWQVLAGAKARGWDVRAITAGFPGALSSDEVWGVPINRIGSESTYPLLLPRYARRVAREFQPDVVLECLNKLPVFSPLYLRTPVVCFVHHLFGDAAFVERGWGVGAALKVMEGLIEYTYGATPFLTGSESSAVELVRAGIARERITVVPYGVDVTQFCPGKKSPQPSLLYVGRIKRYKNVEDILYAAHRLQDRFPELEVHIAGDGDHLPALKREASRLGIDTHVRFHGHVSDATRLALYQQCWATVFPSMKEGFGLTIPEAALCATPTVGYDVPGLVDAIEDEKTGFLAPYRDRDALTGAIARLLEDAALRKTIGAHARERYVSFTWERSVDATLAAIEDAVKTLRPAGEALRHERG